MRQHYARRLRVRAGRTYRRARGAGGVRAVSTDFVSGRERGAYYRQTLHNRLLAGATGWIAWNNTDYDDLRGPGPVPPPPLRDALRHHDSTGAPKTAAARTPPVRRRLLAGRLPRCRRADTDAALVVPSYLERAVPLHPRPPTGRCIFTSLRQAYVAARAADLPVGRRPRGGRAR